MEESPMRPGRTIGIGQKSGGGPGRPIHQSLSRFRHGGRMLPPDPDTRSWHPRVRRLFEYWRSIWPDSTALPGRGAFDPLAVAALLPHLILIDVIGRPPRFRYRLIGTRMVDALNGDLTGSWLDEAHARPGGGVPVFPS